MKQPRKIVWLIEYWMDGFVGDGLNYYKRKEKKMYIKFFFLLLLKTYLHV